MSKRLKRFPIVAIVGRANVGKSTLWNRLTETTRALVSEIPHTTRDRNYGLCLWRGSAVEVVDTGGLDAEQGSEIGRGILRQAELAIREAQLVLFLIDGKVGAVSQDRDLAKHIKNLNKHVLLVINKIDDPRNLSDARSREIYQLNLGEPQAVSASTGRGIGDLMDVIYAELAKRDQHPQPLETDLGLRLVIMGRPNVGKSSIMNAILGEERVIVSPIPHTTREPQDTTFKWRDEIVTLVDTAGMRKRAKIERGLEEEGVERNKRALMNADLALLIFDATQDPTVQDRHLAGLLKDAGRGLILVANKWDLVEGKTTMTATEYERLIRQSFPFLDWAPIIFVSALERQRTDKILDLAFRVREERRRQIAYNALQKFLKTVVARKKPLPEIGPRSPYLHEVTQIGIEPPTFMITVRGEKGTVHVSWLRYFENRLREKFGFQGTPLVINARSVRMREDREPSDKLREEKPKKHPWARKRKPMGRRGGRY